ncbi:MAG: cupin domain-containing protein [Candidatus Sumerlaeia bacterium]|nr:cupin domain-containing protein [Candidatus Sumerlaeia bacterium]
MSSSKEFIEVLGLQSHPEGGAFREVYRSSDQVIHPASGESRSTSTAIYFLLQKGEFSAFHRVTSDETWHLYSGGALELHLILDTGLHHVHRLGMDLAAGERPQLTIPAGVLQAAIPAPGVDHALCGCTVAPGFDFADFTMPARGELLKSHPQHREIITRLTRE